MYSVHSVVGHSFYYGKRTTEHTENTERKPVHCAQNTGLSCSIYTLPRVQFYLTSAMGFEPRNTRKAQKKARRGSRNPNCPNRFPPAQSGFLLLFRKKMQISPKSSKNMYEQTVNTPLTQKPKSWPVSSLFQTSVDSQ